MRSFLLPLTILVFTGCSTATSIEDPPVDDRRGDAEVRTEPDIGPTRDTGTVGTDATDRDVPPDVIISDISADGSCLAADICVTEGDLCDGDTIVRCAEDRDGCLVAIRVPCNPGETCEPSTVTCVEPAGCGDGVADPGEDCDDGNNLPGDGCTGTCHVETGWSCSGTPSDCTRDPITVCGDGALNVGESCDDGNTTSGDGCSDTCSVEEGWRCSGAPSTCTEDAVPACGDGSIDPGEGCDDGNTSDGDGCDSDCNQESGWTCSGAPSNCAADSEPRCGDGNVDAGEECDDGGAVNGGCSDECLTEGGVDCRHISGDLSCLTGRITRNSDDDIHHYDSYSSCDLNSSYNGDEGIFIFRTATSRSVTIDMALIGYSDDWDLMVLQPGASMACDGSMTCPGESSSAGSEESVTFNAEAGVRYVVVVDGLTGYTVDYELVVTCD